MRTPIRSRAADSDIPTVLPVAEDEPAWVEAADEPPSVLPVRSLVRRAAGGLASAWEGLFGVATLIVGLAVLAAIPVVGFLSLGYLLEAGGRIARTDAERQRHVAARRRSWLGRLTLSGWLTFREGCIGVRKAARVGSLVLGTWLMLLPLKFVSSLCASAHIIDPDGPAARGWKAGLVLLTVGMGLHIALAALRGGRLRYFFWPVGNLLWLARRLGRRGYYAEARDAVWDFVASLRLPYYFWLGFRGFVGGLAWLAVPVTLLALGGKAPLLAVLGGGMLAVLLLVLPFLQMRFAAEGRFRALFELGAVLTRFGRAPWAFGLAVFATLLFALPLYLLKIEMVPREAAWLPSLFFIVFIFPSRLLAGWAYGRSGRRAEPRHWFFAATALLGTLPAAAVYILFVYLTQYTSWGGVGSLYEQHAFLLPVPFFGN
jgi:hypothetical protein